MSVALTEDQITPDVTVRAGPESSVTPEGALAFSLPGSAERWPIDIDLLAAGFDLADGGAWSRRVTLYKVGDSDFARFTLKPRASARRFQAAAADRRLYHEGRFLGSVSRPVIVFRDQVTMDNGAARERPRTAPATLLTAAGTRPTRRAGADDGRQDRRQRRGCSRPRRDHPLLRSGQARRRADHHALAAYRRAGQRGVHDAGRHECLAGYGIYAAGHARAAGARRQAAAGPGGRRQQGIHHQGGRGFWLRPLPQLRARRIQGRVLVAQGERHAALDPDHLEQPGAAMGAGAAGSGGRHARRLPRHQISARPLGAAQQRRAGRPAARPDAFHRRRDRRAGL